MNPIFKIEYVILANIQNNMSKGLSLQMFIKTFLRIRITTHTAMKDSYNR